MEKGIFWKIAGIIVGKSNRIPKKFYTGRTGTFYFRILSSSTEIVWKKGGRINEWGN